MLATTRGATTRLVAVLFLFLILPFSSNLKAELNIDSLVEARGYERISDFHEGMAMVRQVAKNKIQANENRTNRAHTWFIDKEGNEYWKDRKYRNVSIFSEGMAVVNKDGYMWFIDKEGNEYWKDRKYKFASIFNSRGVAFVSKSKRPDSRESFIIDKKGNEYKVYGITAIPDGAFFNADKGHIVEVIAPGVTSIGSNAFGGYFELTLANFPSVTNIGNMAFAQCSSLTSIYIPLVTTLGTGVFCSYCSNFCGFCRGNKHWTTNFLFLHKFSFC